MEFASYCVLAAGCAGSTKAMVAALREKQRIVGTLGRHSRRGILRDEELKGAESVVSVLFADIRDFTARCESLAPVDAARFLHLYHEHMTGVIEAHGGIVNQLVGDGIMAIFGATERSPRHADEAISAGRTMLGSLGELGAKLADHGFEPVRIGVGVNTGPAVVGMVGSPRRMEYTAIGDTVNAAARIESLTKELGHSLLVSAATWAAAESKPAGWALDPVSIRGRRAEMTLYAVAV